MKSLLPVITFYCLLFWSFVTPMAAQNIAVTELGRYTDGREGACEIAAYDAPTNQLIITNAVTNTIDLVDVTMLSNPTYTTSITITAYGGGVNSVANLNNGYFAVAVEDTIKQDSGKVVFFDMQGNYVSMVKVGALPDMLTMTKDGNKLLVACEGEPNDAYTIDPEGSIIIIDITTPIANLSANDVKFLDFSQAPSSIAGGVFKPNTNYANDLEPEYIAVNATSTEAAVVCQENNVIILVDLTADTIKAYKGLGFKDHSLAGNGLDVNDKDGLITILPQPVKGVYQPDAIAAYTANGATFYVTANEGDARDYGGYSSEARIEDLTLDPVAFPQAATLQTDAVLGRLKTFTADVLGDTDGDGDVDELYSYGGRSFSIWDANGQLVWDSGDAIAQYIANNHPTFFNCNDGLASKMDNRSDDKGAEPEAVTTGQIGSRTYAFVGLERQGGIMIYDVTIPTAPVFETYVHTFDTATGTSIDVAPEGLLFVPATASQNQQNLLIVSNEVSGTTTIYGVDDLLLHTGTVAAPSSLKVYPNPTQDVLYVEGVASGFSYQYQVCSVYGQVVLEGQLNASKEQLSLRGLPSGCYVLTVVDGAKQVTSYQVIKQ